MTRVALVGMSLCLLLVIGTSVSWAAGTMKPAAIVTAVWASLFCAALAIVTSAIEG